MRQQGRSLFGVAEDSLDFHSQFLAEREGGDVPTSPAPTNPARSEKFPEAWNVRPEREPAHPANPKKSAERTAERGKVTIDLRTAAFIVAAFATGLFVGNGTSGVSAARSELQDVKERVMRLEQERRETQGKILKSGQVAVSEAQFRQLALAAISQAEQSLSEARETAARLQSERDEIAAKLAQIREGKASPVPRAAVRPVSSVTPSMASPANAAAPKARKSPETAAANRLADGLRASGSLPEGSYVYVDSVGNETVVTYHDQTGYGRYFTFERPENAERRTERGLADWVGTQIMQSQNCEIAKQSQAPAEEWPKYCKKPVGKGA